MRSQGHDRIPKRRISLRFELGGPLHIVLAQRQIGFDVRLDDIEPVAGEVGGQAQSWAPMELCGRHRSGRTMLLEVSLAESFEEVQERSPAPSTFPQAVFK
jgi:hypothetical protein